MSLKQLDGMSIKDASNMPHPCDLKRWSDAEYYEIDADLGVFRLTAKGRLMKQIRVFRTKQETGK